MFVPVLNAYAQRVPNLGGRDALLLRDLVAGVDDRFPGVDVTALSLVLRSYGPEILRQPDRLTSRLPQRGFRPQLIAVPTDRLDVEVLDPDGPEATSACQILEVDV